MELVEGVMKMVVWPLDVEGDMGAVLSPLLLLRVVSMLLEGRLVLGVSSPPLEPPMAKVVV